MNRDAISSAHGFIPKQLMYQRRINGHQQRGKMRRMEREPASGYLSM